MPEDADRLVFGLLRAVEGQTATLADLGAQLRGQQRNDTCVPTHTHAHMLVDFTFMSWRTYGLERLSAGEDDSAFGLC